MILGKLTVLSILTVFLVGCGASSFSIIKKQDSSIVHDGKIAYGTILTGKQNSTIRIDGKEYQGFCNIWAHNGGYKGICNYNNNMINCDLTGTIGMNNPQLSGICKNKDGEEYIYFTD